MTPAERLVTIKEGGTLEEAKNLSYTNTDWKEFLVVDDDFNLKGLMTVKDITKATEHPYAAKRFSRSKLLPQSALLLVCWSRYRRKSRASGRSRCGRYLC